VAVTEGSVEVRRDAAATEPVAVLQAGDIARLHGATAEVSRQQDVARMLGWTRGELVFQDTPLREFAEELQRWFDVDCRIDSRAIEELHFTGQLRIGDSLDEILKVVELSLNSLGVKTERDGRTVRFRAGPPVPAALHRGGRAEVGA
jgi:ferric-dicitrate binding protein FerR (iron transport regulator)